VGRRSGFSRPEELKAIYKTYNLFVLIEGEKRRPQVTTRGHEGF
jgi:hypothetical protein